MTRHRLASAALVLTALAAACGSKGGGLERLPLAGSGSPAANAAPGLASRDGAMTPAMFGRVEYQVQGVLPMLPGPASAYKLVADPVADETVVKMAAAFGLKGPLQRSKTVVAVRNGDRALSIQLGTGALPWSLHHVCSNIPAEDPVDEGVTIGCAVSGPAIVTGAGPVTRDTSGSSGDTAASGADPGAPSEPASTPPSSPDQGGGTAARPTMCAQAVAASGTSSAVPATQPSAPAPCPEPARPADLPSQPEARRIGLDAVRAAGLDASGEVRVDDDFSSWRISVEPKVHGVPTINMTTTVSVGPRGVITEASGFLGRADGLGSYPLVGTAAGLDRVRRGSAIGPRALAGAQEPAPPGVAEPDHVVVRNVTGVHLALILFADRLVPAYVFVLDGGPATVPVPAVIDRLLIQPTVPRPLPPTDKGVPQPAKPTP